MTLTNKGLVLQGKAQAGAQLNYTRVAVGDGSLSGQSVPALNGLISLKKNLPIARLRPQPPNKAVIGATLSNADITTGFYFREIGVFAQDPDVGEILYAYANAGVTADYIAAGGGSDIIEKAIDCVVIVGIAANITASIDNSLVFALQSDLDNIAATDSVTPSKTGTLTALLSSLFTLIKGITGKPNVLTAPAISLEATKAHVDDTTRHIAAAERAVWNDRSGYAVTTGTAAALAASVTPAPAALSAGLRVGIKTHVATTGAVTLNLNSLGAKPIKKPNGNNPLLALGGVYTVVYDGSVFILQGEGGEYGTAVAADVLEGTTIGTESGVVPGTLPNLADQDVGGYISTAGSGYLGVVANSDENGVVGKITDSTTIICNDASLIPANFLAGKTVLGMAGIATSEPTVGAAAGDIVASKAATVNGNRIVGTLADKDMGAVAEPAVNAVFSSVLYVRIPKGAYRTVTGSGYPEVKLTTAQLLAAENNFNAAVLKAGITAFGVTGVYAGQQMVSGSGSGNLSGLMTVTNLPFTPKMIILDCDDSKVVRATYVAGGSTYGNGYYQIASQGTSKALLTAWTITANGFSLKTDTRANNPFTYYAWG
nr:phage tail protein [Paenibacillus monticola]